VDVEAPCRHAFAHDVVGHQVVELELHVRLDGRDQAVLFGNPRCRDQLMRGPRELDPAPEVRLAIGRDRLEQGPDASAVGVAADDDVVDAEMADAVLDRGAHRIVGRIRRRHDVGDVADLEQLAGIGAGDLRRRHGAVGAADPQEARLLLFLRQALIEGAVALEMLAEALVPSIASLMSRSMPRASFSVVTGSPLAQRSSQKKPRQPISSIRA
jgi:hypothetical protein